MSAREPRQFGVARTRWRLADLLEHCPWLRLHTLGGLWRLLDRLDLRLKQARAHVHSPDPAYQPKQQVVQTCLEGAVQAARLVGWCAGHPPALLGAALPPRSQILLYQDELTYYRQPTLGRAYAPAGRDARGHTCQPRAELGHRANTTTRVAATLDALSGQVCWWQGTKVGVAALVRLYQAVRQTYPEARRIWLVQDNWPLHWHPDVLVALEPQETPWPPTRPASWPDAPSSRARQRWGHLQLPIQLVFLPTYASWLNPIEKLWRWLKQDVLHLHRQTDDLPTLRAQVEAFLSRFIPGSPDAAALLRYVGLLPIKL